MPPHTCGTDTVARGWRKKIQRTVFGQGPCEAYLRHAHIVLFGKRFDTGVFHRTGGGGSNGRVI